MKKIREEILKGMDYYIINYIVYVNSIEEKKKENKD